MGEGSPPLDPNLEVGPRPVRREGESAADWQERQREWGRRAANKKRAQLKVLRNAMRVGAVDDAALIRGDLTEFEPMIASWKIERVLRACRWIGPNRCHEILEAVRVPPTKRVEEIPYAKRKHMAVLIEEMRQGYVHR